MTKSPFFILGNPRSGTSLLRVVLNAHPQIAVPPESGFLQWWYGKYGDWSRDSLGKLDDFIDHLASSKKIEALGFDFSKLKQFLFNLSPESYADLIAGVYRYYGRRKDLVRWGDKNNYYIDHIDILRAVFPQAQFIVVVRDVRDVACSYRELNKSIPEDAMYRPNLPSDIRLIGEQWNDNYNKINNLINESDYITVRFEDLLRSFTDEVGQILAFLGIQWSDKLRDYDKLNDEPMSTGLWKRKTYGKLDSSVIGRYRTELSESESDELKVICRYWLKHYDYEL